MAHICENASCRYHLPVRVENVPYVRVVEKEKVIQINRHLYRCINEDQEFYLCDVCHEAVRMVTEFPRYTIAQEAIAKYEGENHE